jgi:microcystin-dependent protein
MGQPYVGEIRMFGGSFSPAGWMSCQGQTIPISENDVLFTLIGTTYGGDGEETFNLPDLQGRAPLHQGTGPGGTTYQMGEKAGTESETLTTQQIPGHNHGMIASTAASTLSPSNALLTVPTSSQQGITIYNNAPPSFVALHPNTVQPTGGSQPHDNMQPFLSITFIISLFGVFPSQT